MGEYQDQFFVTSLGLGLKMYINLRSNIPSIKKQSTMVLYGSTVLQFYCSLVSTSNHPEFVHFACYNEILFW
jgi:hypothetical protein